MPIQAYVDESGSRGQGRVLVFAGFIGEAEKWARFSDSWVKCLSEPPSISYFKMAEAAKLRDEFFRWKPEARNQKVRKLAQVINAAGVRCIYYGIDLVAFEKEMAMHWARPVSNPYFLGFIRALAGICVDVWDWGCREEIELIFDHHIIFSQRIKLWYPAWKKTWALENRELTAIYPTEPLFRDDRKFVPLQAADLMAWIFKKHYSREDDRGLSGIVMPELKDTPNSHCSDFVGKAKMKQLVKMSYGFERKYAAEFAEQWKEHPELHEHEKGTEMKASTSEYKNFDRAMRGLLKVTHNEIKAKLDAEKAAKKRKKSRASSASREGA